MLSDCQFGFRKKHSTNLAILSMESMLNLKDTNHGVSSVFLNIRKAFDSVNHKIPIDKLEHYGTRGPVLKLLTSYLIDRKQYTPANDQHCSSSASNLRCPPTKCAMPFLFLAYRLHERLTEWQ